MVTVARPRPLPVRLLRGRPGPFPLPRGRPGPLPLPRGRPGPRPRPRPGVLVSSCASVTCGCEIAFVAFECVSECASGAEEGVLSTAGGASSKLERRVTLGMECGLLRALWLCGCGMKRGSAHKENYSEIAFEWLGKRALGGCVCSSVHIKKKVGEHRESTFVP